MPHRLLVLTLLLATLPACVATQVKDTTRLANVRTTIEPAEVEDLEYLESRVREYHGNYAAQAVQAMIANRYAEAGYTDLVILIDMERQPPTLHTRPLTASERRHMLRGYDEEWDLRHGYVTESEPGDWLVEERVYRTDERVGIPVAEQQTP